MAKKAKKRKQLLIIPAGVNFGVGKTFPPIKNKNTHLTEGVPMVMVGKKGKGTSKSVNTDKKALVIDNINDYFKKHTGFDKNAEMIRPAIFLAALQMIQLVKDDNPIEHEATKERIFQIVTRGCNSNGVNKIGIVAATSLLIQKERVVRMEFERQVKSLENIIEKLRVPIKKEGLTKSELIKKITVLIDSYKRSAKRNKKKEKSDFDGTEEYRIDAYQTAIKLIKQLKD